MYTVPRWNYSVMYFTEFPKIFAKVFINIIKRSLKFDSTSRNCFCNSSPAFLILGVVMVVGGGWIWKVRSDITWVKAGLRNTTLKMWLYFSCFRLGNLSLVSPVYNEEAWDGFKPWGLSALRECQPWPAAFLLQPPAVHRDLGWLKCCTGSDTDFFCGHHILAKQWW